MQDRLFCGSQKRGKGPPRGRASTATHLANELGSDVLDGVLQLDLLGHGDTVVHDPGGAVLALQHNVAPLRPSALPSLQTRPFEPLVAGGLLHFQATKAGHHVRSGPT